MSITPRGSGFEVYVSVKREGQKARFRKIVDTMAEATKLEALARDRLQKGEPVEEIKANPTGVLTLGALLEKVTKAVWSRQKGGRTSIYNAKRMIKALGGDQVDVRTVRSIAIEETKEEFLEEGLSEATVNRYLAAISRMLSYCDEMELIPEYSKPKIRFYPENNGRVRWIDEETEEAKLLVLTRDHGWHDFADLYAVAIDTGMRRGELLALDDQDVKLKETEEGWTGKVYIPENKTNTPRMVPLTLRAATILAARRKAGHNVFQGITPDMIRHRWDTVRAEMGLKDDDQFVFHVCRHSFCTRLAFADTPDLVIMRLAGHTSLATTKRYTHLKDEGLERAVNKALGHKDQNVVLERPSVALRGHTSNAKSLLPKERP